MILRLRRAGISDTNVLRAMELLPRAAFIAQEHSDFAYDERAVPIACGQTLAAPLTIAAMTQALALTGGEKVLEIGTGSGYHAAVLSALCTRVYSVERYKTLADSAKATLRGQGCANVVTRHSDGRYGWRGQAPFDAIIITAGLRVRPVTLLGQLKNGGRLVCVMDDMLTVLTKSFADIEEKTVFKTPLAPLEPGKSKIL